MKIPFSWLSEYVDINVSPEELADKLLNVGFEVEEIIYQGQEISNVVVGKIVEITKNVNSDKLQVCQIDVGEKHGGVIQIVTAATNVFVGALVPASLVGATLVGGINITKATLRGVESYGMFCSGQELGITDDDYPGASVNGILILKDDAKVGQDIKEYLGLNEIIFDVSITANRPDCQSILGIAREAAAVLGQKVKEPNYKFKEISTKKTSDFVKVSVLDNVTCPKYMAKAVTDIKMIETPDWMKKRLSSVGHNSINIFVDITNYVLTEMGQPMHAFDAANIGGSEIVVRRAKENEKLTLLDKSEVNLNSEVLVIADAEKPMAIAGIMGGLNSGINENTQTVVFEAAKFARDKIRKTSRVLGVRSDSSARFEKGVDVYTVEKSLYRALALVDELGCGKIVTGQADEATELVRDKKIDVEVKLIDNLLGISVPHNVIIDILDALGFNAKIKDGILSCDIPNFRDDIDNYADLAEEIIRFYGYDHIEGTLLKNASITHGGYTKAQEYLNDLKLKLVELGYYEAITYSFTNPKYIQNLSLSDDSRLNNPVKLINPLGEDLSVMRTTLVHSMLMALSTNSKKKNDSATLFELAKIYIKCQNQELPNEIDTLCVGGYGENYDFYTMKNVVETVFEATDLKYSVVKGTAKYLHPGRSADVMIGDVCVGHFGELHPDLIGLYEVPDRSCVLELTLDLILKECEKTIKFKTISKFHPVARDLAFILNDDVKMEQVIEIIKENSSKILESVKLFDIYKGSPIPSNQKSMAFAMKFTSVEKALTDTEIDDVIAKIIEEVKNKLGGKLR
ncbi:MAG: phenylalanine--tRNA ligase subunit beta [Clostridia bacterium]